MKYVRLHFRFWKKIESFSEQPDVNFKYEMLLILDTSLDGDYVTWSTYQNYNQLQMEKLRVPVVKAKENDVNGDGRNDELDLAIEMPLLDAEKVYGVKLILIYDYLLTVTTVLSNTYALWKTGRSAQDPFRVNALVRYKEEKIILYSPGFWQLIKGGWIQYVAILVVFWFVFTKIKIFIFQNQIVTTVVERPSKQKSQ
ncbi:hypothetical protein CAPTEDRAFT_227912 [Capitella teleta]|uniref:Transmembrane protein 231 n=1 Tax=Capitella teleta TaxID=283909 RepID=R7UEY6_CAPTE|nr:hypothetical protein CAPTEDRAFT_227912 [Capitella teleta]|eukprot:ELU05079.1 hypothetical protein CAPTEDRAFT_227912 [Capitella teleta]